MEQLARQLPFLRAGRSPLLSDAVVSEFESRVADVRVVLLESGQHSMPISDPAEFSREVTTFFAALDWPSWHAHGLRVYVVRVRS